MPTGKEAQRQPKHAQITMAVNKLSRAIDNYDRLLYEIQGNNIPTEVENKKVTEGPSLSSVLSALPDQLSEFADKLLKIQEDLRSELF